ncbi:MAG TPA: acyl-CoA dehydrogenase family protein [Polyangiaceae bacterium]|nr:acyl-CoA dehydrogenase family protein [Polyangiaceae bacterium]
MPERSLPGFVPPSSPLSPRLAFRKLSPLIGALVRYADLDPWEHDTRTLPRAVALHRRKLRAFAERHLAPVALAVDAEPHAAPGSLGEASRRVLVAAAREGLLSDLLPAPFGSADPRLFAYPLALASSIKTEELAAVDGGLMLLVSAHGLGVAPVILSGDLGALRRVVIPAFRASLAGDPHVFAFAITEPAAGSDVEDGHGASLHRPGVVACPRGDGFVLQGRKCFISGGDIARWVTVFAALEGEGMASWTAFLVDTRTEGFRVARNELKMGMRASGAAELELDDVFVPRERVIGGLRGGWALNRATLTMSRIPVAAMGVGLARAATDAAIEFACSQQLGNKPLIAYQEVQLAIADMLAETQAARATVWAAARRPQALQREASAAKIVGTDTALRVCARAMDLLGNHALTHGARVEKAWRDARLTQIFEGTNQINRLAMVEDLHEQILLTVARLGRNGDPR